MSPINTENMSHTLTEIDIATGVRKLADQILDSYPSGEFVLVGVRSRGDEVASRILDLLKEAGIEVPMGILDISLYRDDLAHLSSNPKLQALGRLRRRRRSVPAEAGVRSAKNTLYRRGAPQRARA